MNLCYTLLVFISTLVLARSSVCESTICVWNYTQENYKMPSSCLVYPVFHMRYVSNSKVDRNLEKVVKEITSTFSPYFDEMNVFIGQSLEDQLEFILTLERYGTYEYREDILKICSHLIEIMNDERRENYNANDNMIMNKLIKEIEKKWKNIKKQTIKNLQEKVKQFKGTQLLRTIVQSYNAKLKAKYILRKSEVMKSIELQKILDSYGKMNELLKAKKQQTSKFKRQAKLVNILKPIAIILKPIHYISQAFINCAQFVSTKFGFV